ncbi:MAG: hypothetical protein ABDH28_05325 [Brevinematia bacterium]
MSLEERDEFSLKSVKEIYRETKRTIAKITTRAEAEERNIVTL